MKLALALNERAQLQVKIRQLCARLNNNAQVQEGETPAEDPYELLKQLSDSYSALEGLIARINRTNAAVMVGNETLTDLLARRDCLSDQVRALREFLDCASATVTRRTASEIRVRSAVDVRALQKQLDQKAGQLRQLDAVIQETNWTAQLK